MEKILSEQRAKSSLDVEALGGFLYGPKYYRDMRQYLEAGPTLDYTPNIYNQGRLALIKDTLRYLPMAYQYRTATEHANIHPHIKSIYQLLVNPHQIPAGVHFGMFIKYIELMGTEEHRRLYLQKSLRCQIIGCYAQTELGHGSDIQSLQTTAEFDPVTKEWILDSPTISSGKYWPGELSFIANHALVFAQTIIKGKKYGVNPFLVQIRDEDYNWLPGIEGGDIGPKLGFHAKENGYMYFRSVRVPKNNLFTKYVEVSDLGEYKKVGDQRVGYGTMMFIRQLITCAVPKTYAQAIIIGTRYSFFRRQGINSQKLETPILDYQTQQEKVLPRIAEYYAMTIAGTRIAEVSQLNKSKVLENDFSLLKETHSNLAFSKALFSELAVDGIEVLRRSMGGHGTSYYSGMPQLENEYSANNTLEGENTVMHLQAARHVLKTYLGFMTQGKPLSESVKYIGRFQQLSETQFTGKKSWSLSELVDLLVKAINHVLGIIGAKITNREARETEMDIINYKVGIRLQQLAQLHGVHFMVHEFAQAISRQNHQQLASLMTEICKLFAISQIQRLAEPILEGGFVCPLKWAMLATDKEAALRAIRPHAAVLLDSFGIPDKYLRSQVVRGNPYENFLNRARECEINFGSSSSARQVGKIREVLASKPLRPSL